ncbi:MAG: DUF3187 family protein [Gammaproteobacteria bacterium]|nr:DUF3187 family protein [Gammaproteobacteria bacterium]MDH3859399.1 DUF3187 family protein [Gammaproteobacteria bacterium]
MRLNRWILLAGVMVLSSISKISTAGVGLATRDLNPVLQPIYLPTQAPVNPDNGWRIDHSFYITNTLQEESESGENLVIDVENYRYELGFSYRKDRWLAQVNIPFAANSGGQLDGLIDSWHELFGLPEGDRDKFPKDEFNIEYLREGIEQFSQDSDTSGLGDLSIAIGFESQNEIRYFVGIELPTGSESDFSGNEAVDFAIWISREKRIDEEMSLYGLLGLSFPADDGTLEGLIVDEIWVAQLGLEYRFSEKLVGIAQLDLHSETIEDSDLDAFDESLQIQLGLGFLGLFENHRVDLFFSEDILVGTAPDISFGARLSTGF